jgi:hypothetical protein
MPLEAPRTVNASIAERVAEHQRKKGEKIEERGDELAAKLTCWLTDVSDSESRQFECEIIEIINVVLDDGEVEWAVIEDALRRIMTKNKVKDDERSRKIAYAALYLLCTKARRENRLKAFGTALENNKDLGQGRGSYDHLWAMLHASRHDDDDLHDALTRAASRLNEFDGAVLREMERLLDTGEASNYAEARQAVDGKLRSNRGRLNTPDGYWVLSIHPEAAGEMKPETVPLARGESVTGLLVTDGLYRLVDTFRVYPDDAKLLEEARRHGLGLLLERLRAHEDEDPGCTHAVRFKPKDDATGLLFEAVAPGEDRGE